MTTLAAFCSRTGVDEAAARQILTSSDQRDDSPWYMQAVLGIGAWITAIAGLFFAWAVMALLFDVEEPNLTVAIMGALVFAGALWLLHRRPEGAFTAHAAVAFATAGTLLSAAGIGFPMESIWAAAIATLPFAAIAIWQQRSILLQFLIVSVALILLFFAVWDRWDSLIAKLPLVFIPFGVALLLYPPRRDVRPAAFALLVMPQVLDALVAIVGTRAALLSDLPAKLLFLAVFSFLFFINWRRVADSQNRLLALAAAAATAVLTFLLPTGASAALVMLALAYTLGSRSLAAIGVLAAGYFIWRFYWDMQETLLTKSIILMAAGAVLLICYGLLMGANRERRRA
jgi:uncharacterized protein DUF4401